MTDTTPTSEKRNGLYDRYPGVEPFKDNAVHQQLFFGRLHEIDHLLHRVRAVRLLILYGKSGLGKSSLLQAGLYPRLREHAFLPIPVRLNTPQNDPVQVVLAALQATCKARGLEYMPQDTSGLWEFFKSTDLWMGEVLLTPVLVFDQFEELFTLQSGTFRAALGAQLGELASRGLPARLYQRAEKGERSPYSDAPPDVKLILSLREEYLGGLEDLAPNVPAIFEQRFRLAPLGKEVARSAIIEPAKLDRADLFKTRPFRYQDSARDDMLEFLANRQGEVEPFQLQILCRHAEQQVAKRQQEQGGDIEVDQALLGGHKAMETLVENFYRDALLMVSGWLPRRRARDLCEVGLLSPTGHRVSLDQGNIQERFKLDGAVLDKLADTRLVRKEYRPALEGFYYELSHDSVARAVNRSRRYRVPTRVKIVGTGSLLFMILIATWLWLQADKAERHATEAQQRAEVTASVSQSSVEELLQKGGLREPEMVSIPGGKFRMGKDTYDQPMHDVTIQSFAMGRYEVTFEEYDQFALATSRPLPTDSGWGRGSRPVITVGWKDAEAYAHWLSEKSGKRYRFPTEAEWEYAARSGGRDETWAGTSNEEELKNYAVYSADRTEPVGSKKPNGLGLYDMSGNVWEWVEDCWHEDYTRAPTNGSAWLEENGGNCGRRVLRGGSWSYTPAFLRASSRIGATPVNRISGVGFRLAQDFP